MDSSKSSPNQYQTIVYKYTLDFHKKNLPEVKKKNLQKEYPPGISPRVSKGFFPTSSLKHLS